MEMDSRSNREYNQDMCTAINAELDRLGWSSDTAPAGKRCLDAFPTEDAGIIVISDPQEETAFYSEPLLRVLYDLAAPLSYDDVCHAIRPYRVDND